MAVGLPPRPACYRTRRMVTRTSSTVSFADRLRGIAAAAGFHPSEAQLDAFCIHHRLLRRWGERMNLTGLKDDEAIARRHFLEPIAAAPLLDDRGTLLDLGSGNGFPAIPLKVLRPGLRLVLVEASEKKSAFLSAVLRELGMRDARVETRRIGGRRDLADLLPCRYLTIRAVRVRDLLKGEGPPILEPGGRALLFVAPDEAEAIRKRPLSGLRFVEARPLPSSTTGSTLAVLEPAPVA